MMDDYADLFCELYDGVDVAAFSASVERWSSDPALLELAAEVQAMALTGALRVDRVRAATPADAGGDGSAHRYAVLRGLDAAFADVNPTSAHVPPPALTEYALRYAESGRLDSGRVGGGLLPRFVRPGRRGQLPDDLADAFVFVTRVAPAEWSACDHVTLPAWARLARPDRDPGLRIAATPLIADPDELLWEVVERASRRFYRIHPANDGRTRRRIASIIASFDRHGATIGVAPELCLSAEMLEDWRAALADRPGGLTSALRLVLVGSGNVDGSEPPSNTAVLLDAQTGEALVGQRKVYRFNFSPADVERWGLADRLPAPIDEDLLPGTRITVVETGGARLAILVCEDLARLHAFSGRLSAHGVSLILVPVFARPIRDRRWERARAEPYGDATGSTILVANSLVVGTILGTPPPMGAALAVASGHAVVGHASRADDVVVFTLDGDRPSLVHEPGR
jgi:predicted amidohydrolase